MARLMSVAMTEQAVIERHKTVTRRKGWWVDKNGRHLLKPGDRLVLCRKVMGRKPGEPLVRLAEVEVVDVRREPLRTLLSHRTEWAAREMVREGFPDMNPRVFVDTFFVAAQGMTLDDDVTRIEWRYLPGVGPIRPWTDDTWTPGIDGRRLPDVRRGTAVALEAENARLTEALYLTRITLEATFRVLQEASGLPDDIDDPDCRDEMVLALRPRAEKAEAENARLVDRIERLSAEYEADLPESMAGDERLRRVFDDHANDVLGLLSDEDEGGE